MSAMTVIALRVVSIMPGTQRREALPIYMIIVGETAEQLERKISSNRKFRKIVCEDLICLVI